MGFVTCFKMWQVLSLLLLLCGEHVKAEKCNYAKRVGEFKGQTLSRNKTSLRVFGVRIARFDSWAEIH